MQIIRVSPKLSLVFGLHWMQHDEILYGRHAQIQRWREDGYRFAASYKHAGGRVYGLHKPIDASSKLPKRCVSGAAVIATHPELAGKTGIVLIQYQEHEAEKTSVIFVGLRAGVVVMDFIIEYDQIAEQRTQFLRQFLAPGEAPQVWGDLAQAGQVDFSFAFEQLSPNKRGGQACPLTELRSSRILIVLASVVGVVVLFGVGYQVWQINEEHTAKVKAQLALSQNTAPIVYAKEIERWEAREVNFVSPSIAYLRKELKDFPVLHAGWMLTNITCVQARCVAQWARQTGTLEEFRAAAPAAWQVINPLGQNTVDTQLDLKLPVAKIDRNGWPKFIGLRDKLVSHWQFLSATGWRAELGEPKKLAVPPYFTPEQLKEIQSYPNPPYGVQLTVSEQPWWLTSADLNSPVSAEQLGDQVELTEALVVTYNGKDISFSFKGIVYVQQN